MGLKPVVLGARKHLGVETAEQYGADPCFPELLEPPFLLCRLQFLPAVGPEPVLHPRLFGGTENCLLTQEQLAAETPNLLG